MYFYPVYLFSALFVFVLPLFFLFQGIFFSPFQLFFPLLFNSSPLLFFFPLHLNLLFPLVFLFSLSFLYSGLLQIFLFCLLGFLLCGRHFHALKMAVEFRNLPVDIVSFFSGNIEIGMHQLCMYSSCLCNLAFFYCRVTFFQKIAALFNMPGFLRFIFFPVRLHLGFKPLLLYFLFLSLFLLRLLYPLPLNLFAPFLGVFQRFFLHQLLLFLFEYFQLYPLLQRNLPLFFPAFYCRAYIRIEPSEEPVYSQLPPVFL